MKFEYPVLILLATVGMMTMVSASDLIVLYLGSNCNPCRSMSSRPSAATACARPRPGSNISCWARCLGLLLLARARSFMVIPNDELPGIARAAGAGPCRSA